MAYRLLLDENIEHEVMDRLADAGHDVERVDTVAELGKGANDTDLAAYSTETDRAIVTYDDGFIEDVPPTAYRATLFFEDETLTAREGRDDYRRHGAAVSVRRSEGIAEDGPSVAVTLLP